jgi:hypothetical protein
MAENQVWLFLSARTWIDHSIWERTVGVPVLVIPPHPIASPVRQREGRPSLQHIADKLLHRLRTLILSRRYSRHVHGK